MEYFKGPAVKVLNKQSIHKTWIKTQVKSVYVHLI